MRQTMLVAGLSLAALSGSCQSRNDRLSLGDGPDRVDLEIFADAPGSLELHPSPAPDADAPGGYQRLARPADEPSARSLDRSSWPAMAIHVPPEGTITGPHFSTAPTYTRATARQRAENPSALSALELGTRSADVQVAEAWAAPFHAGLDVLLLIPRAFQAELMQVRQGRGPALPHERTSVLTSVRHASPTPTGEGTDVGEDR